MTILVAALLAVGLLAIPAVAADGDADLSVVHGIPDTPVDIYVDGSPVDGLQGFEFGSVAGPLPLPSGEYLIEIYAAEMGPKTAGAETSGVAPVLSGTVALSPGGNVTAVANLDASGAPVLSAFNNDTSLTNVGQGRVTARHLAKAPAVDILAGGAVLFGDVENGESGAADVPPGTYGVSINLAGTPTQVFPATGSAPVPVSTNTSVIAYAIGDPAVVDGFTVATQIINLGAPSGYANVSIVHGVPGVTVDVYLNGNLAVAGFEPETITDRMLLAAGTYDIAIYAENADPLVDAPVITAAGVAVPAGADASVVAHYDAAGKLTASVFIDDLSMTDSGKGRLTVRHTAEAPGVDVLANGGVLFTDLVNGDSESADVDAATYQVTLNSPTGSSSQVFPATGSVPVAIAEGTSTTVYAIGMFPDTFTLIASVVDGVGGFEDTAGSVHEDNIIKMATLGITKVDDSYRPEEDVTRGQMAAFLRRALNLPSSSTDFFTDDNDSIFEDDINSIAQYGITVGSGGEYRPNEPVTRGQMAAFIKRAFQLGAGGATPFTDIATNIFKGDIEAIFAAEITVGTTPTTYSPNDAVTRGQMATFLARALGLE